MGLEVHVLDAETGKIIMICSEDGKMYGSTDCVSKAIHLLAVSLCRGPIINIDKKGKTPNGA